MPRRTVDSVVGAGGGALAVVLLLLGVLALIGADFAASNVNDRLRPQKIYFPSAQELREDGITQRSILDNAGKQVRDGGQAKIFADMISEDLKGVNGGRTYSETSALSRKNPGDAALKAKTDTLFRGETLRSMLLNAYGWWFVAQVIKWTGIALLILAAVVCLATVLGVRRVRRSRVLAEA